MKDMGKLMSAVRPKVIDKADKNLLVRFLKSI
ncbi:GatB/YqeY domain-containing protein [Clostridium sp.]|nr:GatB/YqeY domain-containing protein [Clostridium sp.]